MVCAQRVDHNEKDVGLIGCNRPQGHNMAMLKPRGSEMNRAEGNHPQANQRESSSSAEGEDRGFVPRGPACESRCDAESQERTAPVPQSADASQPVVSGEEG